MALSVLKEQLTNKETFGFVDINKAEDIKGYHRYCIDMSSKQCKVIFDGFIELHKFEGLLLLEQKLKVLCLVIKQPQKLEGNKLNSWVEAQLETTNLTYYTLRQKPPSNSISAKNIQDWATYTVEVLILTEEQKQSQLESALSQLAKMGETEPSVDLLHLMSVNKLLFKQTGNKVTFNTNNIKAAMPWLLTDYMAWHQHKNNGKSKIFEIKKQNYRLPGTRTIALTSYTNLHLFHGYNGSGKSTLAEVIELLQTNKIARLAGVDRDKYHEIVVNHHNSENEAKVTFKVGVDGNKPNSAEIVVSDREEDSPVVNSGAFMLNQELMDGLSRQSGSARLRLFETAFFSQDSEQLDAFEQKAAEIEKWRAALAIRLGWDSEQAAQADHEQLFERLTAAIGSRNNELISIYLPVPSEQLVHLKTLIPQQAGTIKKLIDENFFDTSGVYLQQLQESLNTVFADATLLPILEQGQNIITELSQWYYKGTQSQESYSVLWHQYATVLAQLDLLELRLQLDKFCSATYGEGGSDALQVQAQRLALDDGLLVADQSREQLNHQLIELKQQRLSLKQQLQTLWDGEPSGQNLQDFKHKQLVVKVSVEQTLMLNKVGQYLTDLKGKAVMRLGDVLLSAVNHNTIEDSAEWLDLAERNWAEPLLIQLERLIAVVKAWLDAEQSWQKGQLQSRGAFDATSWWQLCNEAHTALGDYTKLQAQMGESFLAKLNDKSNPLIKPLNELLQLFTPARWLYKELSVVRDSQSKQLKLQLVKSNGEMVDAALVWNTAEMNLFAIALFLLCSNHAEHNRPTNTLVMDDPLQNMDELTTTYFARGLAKLVHYWRSNNTEQQLLMLFHGEQAIDKFSDELPAAVYQLPWPNGGDQKVELQMQMSSFEQQAPYPFNQKLTITN